MHTEVYYDSLPSMLKRYDKTANADRFRGNSAEELEKWQNKERKLLWNLLGLDKLMPDEDPAEVRDRGCGLALYEGDAFVMTGSEEIEDGICRKKYLFRVDEDSCMPMYILEPAGLDKGSVKGTILALAGHQGGGKESVAGVRQSRAVAERIDFFNYDYGVKLARLGYVAICPDPRGFGERRDRYAQGDSGKEILSCSCRNLANMAIPLGLTVVGLCVYDYIRFIDFLAADGRWKTDDLGVVGFSGGAMQALFLAALDSRIKMTFISGYMYGYKDSLLMLNNNCSCNYVPGLWEHLDMGDIASMIAPRPLFIQSCEDDHLNGHRGMDNVYEQVEIIRRVYRLTGAEDSLCHDVRKGEHHFHDEPLKEVLERFGKR